MEESQYVKITSQDPRFNNKLYELWRIKVHKKSVEIDGIFKNRNRVNLKYLTGVEALIEMI